MNISEETLESGINELIDKLENDKNDGDIKLMNDNIFIIDDNLIDKLENVKDNISKFDFGEPKKNDENITYI